MLEKISLEKEDVMTQWTSVDHDLPYVGQQVLVARENGDVTMASYEALRTSETTVYLWVEFECVIKDVLYWMPLPTHPAEEAGAAAWQGGSTLEDYGYLNPDEYYD